MIGLLFFAVIGLWAVIAVTLGIKLPKWLDIKRFRTLVSVLLVPLIFFAPVADEIIAYPQIVKLCEDAQFFSLAPSTDEKKAYGRTVYYTQKISTEAVWPSTVEVERMEMVYVDATTKEPILVRNGFHVKQGMLGMPAGSSGNTMAILLNGCGPKIESYDSQGLPSRFGHLNLKKIPSP